MNDAAPSDFGTPESKKHGVFKIDPRDVSNGGRIISTGHTNQVSDLLEALYFYGHLRGAFEDESEADRRVADGRGFQEIYTFFRSRGKDLGAAEMVYRMMPTLAGHVYGEKDISETVYYLVMRRLGKHARTIESVCIYGELNTGILNIRKALDALPAAMQGARREVEERIEAHGTP